jgi:hypothetical protein
MFSTNGYRQFEMTRVARASAAKKAIATYSKALETGFGFNGDVVAASDRAWLVQAIADQRAVIEEVKAMTFHPGEW